MPGKTLPGLLIICLLSVLAVPLSLPAPVAAEPAPETVRIYSDSGRLSLEIDEDWAASTRDGVWDYRGYFNGEVIHVSPDADELTATLGDGIAAPRLTAVFAFIVAPESGDMQDVLLGLFPQMVNDADVEFLEINGYPAARHREPEDARLLEYGEYGGETLVIADGLVYIASYVAPDEAGVDLMEDVATTLQFHPHDLSVDAEFSRDSFSLDTDALQIGSRPGWLHMEWVQSYNGIYHAPEDDASQPRYYLILPESQRDFFRQLGSEATTYDLPGLMMQISVHPYDTLFGTSATDVDADMRLEAATSLVNDFGTADMATAAPAPVRDTKGMFVAMTDVFGGANQGVGLVLDMNQAFYSIVIAAPAAEWDSTYAPLVAEWLETITVAAPSYAAGEVPVGVQVGLRAPDFTVRTLDGDTVSLSDFRGQPVLLNFWATWCPPCRTEMPTFQYYYTENQDEVVILAVDVMETDAEVQDFVDEFGLTFPIGMDYTGEIAALYNIPGYPSSYIINPEGIITMIPYGSAPMLRILDRWFDTARE